MTVKDLREILAAYPDGTLVITTFCSDYTSLPEPTTVQVIPNWDNDYYQKFHPEQFRECTCISMRHEPHRLSGPKDEFFVGAYGIEQATSKFAECGVALPEVVTAIHFEGN